MGKIKLTEFKGFIYKIKCKDTSINNFYIGSTENMHCRKIRHKHNNKAEKYNFKLYKFMEKNGGFANWEFEIIEERIFRNTYEMLATEITYIINDKPELNSRVGFMCGVEVKKYLSSEVIEIINEMRKDYILQKRKERDNKERILCSCGGSYTYSNKSRHFKTKKHLLFMENTNEEIP